MSDVQILVVEDDPDGADMVKMMLSSAGVGTTLASSAEVALARIKGNSETYNAVIVDLALPEMDGFELLQAIRKQSLLNNVPLVAVTAYHTPELKVKALDAGFDAYFPKPLDTTIFLQSLERLLQ